MSKTIRSSDREYETIRDGAGDYRTAKAKGKSRPAGRMERIIKDHLLEIDQEDWTYAR